MANFYFINWIVASETIKGGNYSGKYGKLFYWYQTFCKFSAFSREFQKISRSLEKNIPTERQNNFENKILPIELIKPHTISCRNQKEFENVTLIMQFAVKSNNCFFCIRANAWNRKSSNCKCSTFKSSNLLLSSSSSEKKRTETEISKKNKLPFFRQNKAENLNLNKRN